MVFHGVETLRVHLSTPLLMGIFVVSMSLHCGFCCSKYRTTVHFFICRFLFVGDTFLGGEVGHIEDKFLVVLILYILTSILAVLAYTTPTVK